MRWICLRLKVRGNKKEHFTRGLYIGMNLYNSNIDPNLWFLQSLLFTWTCVPTQEPERSGQIILHFIIILWDKGKIKVSERGQAISTIKVGRVIETNLKGRLTRIWNFTHLRLTPCRWNTMTFSNLHNHSWDSQRERIPPNASWLWSSTPAHNHNSSPHTALVVSSKCQEDLAVNLSWNGPHTTFSPKISTVAS